MSHDTRAISADELFAMPDDGNRYELVQGELRMMSPTGGRHGRIALKLARRLGDYVEQHHLGETFAAETGFLIAQGPDTVLAPDVAFVSYDHLGDLADHPGYLPLAPDLVAEVVSLSDRSSDVEKEVLNWLAAGVSIVLVVDPQTRTVRDYRAADAVREYEDGTIDLGEALPGFRLNVPELLS